MCLSLWWWIWTFFWTGGRSGSVAPPGSINSMASFSFRILSFVFQKKQGLNKNELGSVQQHFLGCISTLMAFRKGTTSSTDLRSNCIAQSTCPSNLPPVAFKQALWNVRCMCRKRQQWWSPIASRMTLLNKLVEDNVNILDFDIDTHTYKYHIHIGKQNTELCLQTFSTKLHNNENSSGNNEEGNRSRQQQIIRCCTWYQGHTMRNLAVSVSWLRVSFNDVLANEVPLEIIAISLWAMNQQGLYSISCLQVLSLNCCAAYF